MNSYLAARRNAYNALSASITEMQTRATSENRDLTPDELTLVRSQGAEQARMLPEIETLTEQENRSAAVARVSAALLGASDDRAGSRPAPLMPSSERMIEMRSALAEGSPLRFTTAADAGFSGPQRLGSELVDRGQHNRATVTLVGDLGTPSTPLMIRPTIEPRRLAVAAGLPVDYVGGVGNVIFPVFGDADAAAITAEGVLKAEYDDVSPGTIAPKMIALWMDFTLQAQISHPAFESRLRSKIAQQVARREDLLLLTTVLAAGIPTQAPAAIPMAEALLIAAGTVSSTTGMNADLIVVNPADLGSIFGGGLAATNPGELGELDLQLWGAKVYPSSSIAAGTALVGAWAACSRLLVGLAPVWKVDPFTQMKTNVITVMLEEAVNIGVDEPTGFLSVDLVV